MRIYLYMVIKMQLKHNALWIKLGLNIAYYRKERGLTQQSLAEMSNISRNYLQRIEGGGSASVETFMSVADALDIPLCKIFEFRD